MNLTLPPCSSLEKISRETGVYPTACACQECQNQCKKQACTGTPEDIGRLIDAGYGDRLVRIVSLNGVFTGACSFPITMLAPMYDAQKGACTFFMDGRCELHDKGLKPTEGYLSNHKPQVVSDPRDTIAFRVARQWIPLQAEILRGMNATNNPEQAEK